MLVMGKEKVHWYLHSIWGYI